jgi:hypothetical protein
VQYLAALFTMYMVAQPEMCMTAVSGMCKILYCSSTHHIQSLAALFTMYMVAQYGGTTLDVHHSTT